MGAAIRKWLVIGAIIAGLLLMQGLARKECVEDGGEWSATRGGHSGCDRD